MRTRQLTEQEEKAFLRFRAVFPSASLLYPSKTSLDKGILDAHRGIRLVLSKLGIHNYLSQGKGEEHKVLKPLRLYTRHGAVSGNVTLYRPTTKDGDPRIWLSIRTKDGAFSSIAVPDEMYALSAHRGVVVVCQLTGHEFSDEQLRLALEIEPERGAIVHSMSESAGFEKSSFKYREQSEDADLNCVVGEIIDKLRTAAGRYIPSAGKGDMAIGKTIEKVLGIQANSRRDPDYKGVELKSYRYGQSSTKLTTLFSKTPDWKRGPMDALTIVKKYGWPGKDGERLQVYCSISAEHRPRNAKGFFMKLNEAESLLEVWNSAGPECVAFWPLDWLRKSLDEKHARTVWICAESSESSDGLEQFRLVSAKVTGAPSFDALLEAIETGEVSVDFTMKQKGSGTKDHGYLFRIQQDKLDSIFWAKPTLFSF